MKGLRSVEGAVGAAVIVGLTVMLGAAAPAKGKPAGNPYDFRSWAHVKSMVVVDRDSAFFGFHNVYADEIALATLKEGGPYREGARLAVSIHELETRDGGTVQGKRIKVGFMRKDKSAVNTGGWRYSLFGPDGREKTILPAKACHECHAKAKDTDCVFSRYVH